MNNLKELPFVPTKPDPPLLHERPRKAPSKAEVGIGWQRAAACEAILRDFCEWHKAYPRDRFYTPEEMSRAAEEMEAIHERAKEAMGFSVREGV